MEWYIDQLLFINYDSERPRPGMGHRGAARKDQLSKAPRQLPADDKRSQAHVKEQIENCNQALLQDKFEVMAQEQE